VVGSVVRCWSAWSPAYGARRRSLHPVRQCEPVGKLRLLSPLRQPTAAAPVIPGSTRRLYPLRRLLVEGLKVGYKWYDSNRYTPEFPFGFGLSYTTFQFSNIALVNNLARD